MEFTDVLKDIEKLRKLNLKAINPKTSDLLILSIDEINKKYSFRLGTGRTQSRPFSQLELIWNELSNNRVVNVETVLEGATSSRHVPETILANLPYVEHFKYNRKKHLFLNSTETHPLGTLQEAKGSDVRKLRSVLDHSKEFDRSKFASELEDAIEMLKEAVKEARVKFPGEFKASKLQTSESNLIELLSEIQGTFVAPIDEEELASEEDYIHTISSSNNSLNAPEIIGYEGGEDEEAEDFADGTDTAQDNEQNQLSNARIRFNPTTVSLIYDRLLHNEIELQPDFQRKDRIWNSKNKSALIESILIGLPLPTFYFAERDNASWLIVDGLQRITTLFDFISNKFALQDLKFLGELNGDTFEELPRPYQRKIREYQLHCHIISIKKDSDAMVRELFQRINTYGVKMSYQEIRCALHPGNSVKFLRFLAESKEFQDATFGKIQPKRMKDMELVLGAVSHILNGYENFSEAKFDTFLTNSMKQLNTRKRLSVELVYTSSPLDNDTHPVLNSDKSDPLLNNVTVKFNHALGLATEIFGSSRFKKEVNGKIISKPLFEMIVSVFALLPQSQQDALVLHKKTFSQSFFSLVSGDIEPFVDWDSEHYESQDRGFEYAISQSTGKRVTILYRFENFLALISDVINEPVKIKGLLEQDDK